MHSFVVHWSENRQTQIKGTLDLNTVSSIVEVDKKKNFIFDVVTEKRTYRFSGTRLPLSFSSSLLPFDSGFSLFCLSLRGHVLLLTSFNLNIASSLLKIHTNNHLPHTSPHLTGVLLAFNAEEYEAWVTGLGNLLTAMEYPTPYDFKNVPVIDRIVHNHRPYDVVRLVFPSSLVSFCP